MKIHGKTLGLKRSEIRALERLFRRRVSGSTDVTVDIVRVLVELSFEIERRIGLLFDRQGRVKSVCVGDATRIVLPDHVREMRLGKERLCGLRLVHTRLKGDGLAQPDLTDLLRFRLDLTTQIRVAEEGLPGDVHRAHLMPPNREDKSYEVLGPFSIHEEEAFEFRGLVAALEEEFASKTPLTEEAKGRERVFLVAVTTKSPQSAKASLAELSELARSSGALVVDQLFQRRSRIDSRTIVGRGMMREIALRRLRSNADVVVFDRELTPAQARNIERELAVKVIDRSQLILDIFAQRAVSAEGKLQVELARLRYMLPHLTYGRDSLAQIRGGIGSNRGVGEKKSELDRRSVRERVQRLELRLKELSKRRTVMRKKRLAANVPTVAIVGYTNAGKSTLFNRLTRADVAAEDLLFATLETTARRTVIADFGPVVLSDTVGFIHELPEDLVAAFRATLEELGEADLLLHVADASAARVENQVASVRKILHDMEFDRIPQLMVFNKSDRIDREEFGPLARNEDGLLVSAFDAEDIERLRGEIAHVLGRRTPRS